MLWRLIRLYLGTYAFIYSCKNNDWQIEAINLKETKELYMAGFRWGRKKKEINNDAILLYFLKIEEK